MLAGHGRRPFRTCVGYWGQRGFLIFVHSKSRRGRTSGPCCLSSSRDRTTVCDVWPGRRFPDAAGEFGAKAPHVPLFGAGETALQPSYVEDVADAVVRILDAPSPEPIYELGGPRIYRYSELVQTLAKQLGTRSALIPVPFWAWKIAALVAEGLPRAPLTRNQVELMQIDNVASLELPGFTDLGIAPTWNPSDPRRATHEHNSLVG